MRPQRRMKTKTLNRYNTRNKICQSKLMPMMKRNQDLTLKKKKRRKNNQELNMDNLEILKNT